MGILDSSIMDDCVYTDVVIVVITVDVGRHFPVSLSTEQISYVLSTVKFPILPFATDCWTVCKIESLLTEVGLPASIVKLRR